MTVQVEQILGLSLKQSLPTSYPVGGWLGEGDEKMQDIEAKKSKAFALGQQDAANGESCRFAKCGTRPEMQAYVHGWNSTNRKNVEVKWLNS